MGSESIEEKPVENIEEIKQTSSITVATGQSQTKGEAFEGLKKEVKDALKPELKEFLRDKVDAERPKIIESLGIFVALFTFISINISIFNRISDLWSAGIFIFLIFCAIAMMIVLMDFLLIKHNNKKFLQDTRIRLLFIFFIIAFLSIFSLRYFPLNPLPGSIEFENKFNKQINDKINNSIDDNNKNYYTSQNLNEILDKKAGKEDLQIITDCLKGKKYWQYEQCFN